MAFNATNEQVSGEASKENNAVPTGFRIAERLHAFSRSLKATENQMLAASR